MRWTCFFPLCMRSKGSPRVKARIRPIIKTRNSKNQNSKNQNTMSRALRSTVKGLAQKLLGQSDVGGFVRTRQLWLSKQIYRRPVQIAELRGRLIDLGVTRGRTVWVQSSWNEFFNVPMRPSEVIDLLRELIGSEGTLAMPAFPIDQDPGKVFLVDRAPVYTGLLCEVFRRSPGVLRSIHLGSSVCAIGPNADFLIRDHHHTNTAWGETGEHEFMPRTGDIRPQRLRRHFGPDICVETQISNLKMIAADAKPFVEHAVALGRRGITMYVQPVPKKVLFIPFQRPIEGRVA